MTRPWQFGRPGTTLAGDYPSYWEATCDACGKIIEKDERISYQKKYPNKNRRRTHYGLYRCYLIEDPTFDQDAFRGVGSGIIRDLAEISQKYDEYRGVDYLVLYALEQIPILIKRIKNLTSEQLYDSVSPFHLVNFMTSLRIIDENIESITIQDIEDICELNYFDETGWLPHGLGTLFKSGDWARPHLLKISTNMDTMAHLSESSSFPGGAKTILPIEVRACERIISTCEDKREIMCLENAKSRFVREIYNRYITLKNIDDCEIKRIMMTESEITESRKILRGETIDTFEYKFPLISVSGPINIDQIHDLNNEIMKEGLNARVSGMGEVTITEDRIEKFKETYGEDGSFPGSWTQYGAGKYLFLELSNNFSKDEQNRHFVTEFFVECRIPNDLAQIIRMGYKFGLFLFSDPHIYHQFRIG